MITDRVPEQEPLPIEPLGDSSHTFKFALLFVLFAALAIGEFYTLHKISSLKDSLEAQQAQTRKELNAQFQDQLSGRLTALERMNAQQLEAVKQELDAAAKRTGKTGSELKRARALVAKLQSEQQQQAEKLQEEIAQKADAQQLGALTQDVSAQRSDLDRTKKSLDSMRSDLGMTRSEFGTLIARNHDEIEQLRKMGERDYFEFTLDRNSPQRVANVGLILKKTNLKRHRFNLVVNVDDMEVEKKDRTINEPIFFYVNGSKKPYELVVNRVQSNQVKGYISTPRGATEVAARSEGTR
jgi:hypothetical protein